MIDGINVVFIHVKDPVKLANWYKEILELEIGFSTPDLHWQEFTLPENRSPTRFALDSIGDDPSEVEKQSIMISFKVSDIVQAVWRLESKGIEFYGKEKIIDAGSTLFATFRDIEENWIQISQRK